MERTSSCLAPVAHVRRRKCYTHFWNRDSSPRVPRRYREGIGVDCILRILSLPRELLAWGLVSRSWLSHPSRMQTGTDITNGCSLPFSTSGRSLNTILAFLEVNMRHHVTYGTQRV
eukprot:5673875-Amphidinium_carterae.1